MRGIALLSPLQAQEAQAALAELDAAGDRE
jgi:hypothetical protein